MLFNSLEFLVFLPLVYIIYWFFLKKSYSYQNIFILAASYVFYGWWDWRFLFLLLLSTCIDYFFGLIIHQSEKRKKLFLWLSIANNLIVLVFFKYYNFFAESFAQMMGYWGFHVSPFILEVVLPVGISFYTFHGMSYVFDIYRNKFTPVKSFIDYGMFVSFFPLLVAGPIERATHLLPQIVKKRKFSYKQSAEGLRLIVWGFFKKIIIADALAPAVKDVFEHYNDYSGLTLIIGAVYFAFQIYGDFSGYSDIAMGTAKLFGFELLSNFRFPYFSRDIAEFWRRWHISLSSWFRDYLYFPLGGSREGKWKAVRNTFIIFLVSGFWHGASWNFIIWGGIHALLFLPLLLLNRNRVNVTQVVAEGKMLPSIKEIIQMLVTFALVTLAWIFFRAPDLHVSVNYIKNIFLHFGLSNQTSLNGFVYIPFLLIGDWLMRHDERNVLAFKNKWIRYLIYIVIIDLVLEGLLKFSEQDFIYFQF